MVSPMPVTQRRGVLVQGASNRPIPARSPAVAATVRVRAVVKHRANQFELLSCSVRLVRCPPRPISKRTTDKTAHERERTVGER
jgi:hypothetical protein